MNLWTGSHFPSSRLRRSGWTLRYGLSGAAVKTVFRPADGDIDKLADMIEAAKKVAIFGGDGCRDARDEVLELAARLNGESSEESQQWFSRSEL